MTSTEQHILQSRLARFLVSDVFNTISEDDILKSVAGTWMHKGSALTEGQVAVIKKEADTFKKTNVYPLLLAEIRYLARGARDKAVTESDLITSSLLAYFADVIESKIEKMASGPKGKKAD